MTEFNLVQEDTVESALHPVLSNKFFRSGMLNSVFNFLHSALENVEFAFVIFLHSALEFLHSALKNSAENSIAVGNRPNVHVKRGWVKRKNPRRVNSIFHVRTQFTQNKEIVPETAPVFSKVYGKYLRRIHFLYGSLFCSLLRWKNVPWQVVLKNSHLFRWKSVFCNRNTDHGWTHRRIERPWSPEENHCCSQGDTHHWSGRWMFSSPQSSKGDSEWSEMGNHIPWWIHRGIPRFLPGRQEAASIGLQMWWRCQGLFQWLSMGWDYRRGEHNEIALFSQGWLTHFIDTVFQTPPPSSGTPLVSM